MLSRIACYIFLIFSACPIEAQYLSYQQQEAIYLNARYKIKEILNQTKMLKDNDRIKIIIQNFLDIPYLYHAAMGESDWQAHSLQYQPGYLHLQQFPTYRFDGLDCQTLVQNVMALNRAHHFSEFESNLIKISYGAAHPSDKDKIHFYNRNHFIEGDFNRINQQQGLLEDVTARAPLKDYSNNISTILNRQRWFDVKKNDLDKTIAVFDEDNVAMMKNRYEMVYNHLPFDNFKQEKVAIHYLPKNKLMLRDEQGEFYPNFSLLNLIPTPAIMEIVRDPARWHEEGLLIKDKIGTNLLISHMGVLYRQIYKRHEWIYDRVYCHQHYLEKTCDVTPIFCQKNKCEELMFAHTTTAYTDQFYWYRSNNKPHCTAGLPDQDRPYTFCNRVESVPLAAYLLSYQDGRYTFMHDNSILGVHVEKLN